MGESIVRVRYRSGVVEHFGPMSDYNARSKVAAIRRLAQDPRSDFAAAAQVRRAGGAHDLGHRIAIDAHDLFGTGWDRHLPGVAKHSVATGTKSPTVTT